MLRRRTYTNGVNHVRWLEVRTGRNFYKNNYKGRNSIKYSAPALVFTILYHFLCQRNEI